jgi:hypothetical protein
MVVGSSGLRWSRDYCSLHCQCNPLPSIAVQWRLVEKGVFDEAERDFGGTGTAAASPRRDGETRHDARRGSQDATGFARVGRPTASGRRGGSGRSRVGVLAGAPRRPLKLSRVRRGQLPQMLARGAGRHGFGTELWTLSRMAEVIYHRWWVSYHPSQG